MDSFTCFNSHLKDLSDNSDIGCGFLLLWSLKQVLQVLGMFLLLGLGFKVLKFGSLCDSGGKLGRLSNGVYAKNCLDLKCSSNISSCKCRLLKYVHNKSPPVIDKLEKTELLNSDADDEATNVCSEEFSNDNDDGDSGGDDDENQHYDEDEEFDVLALRKLIKTERHRANSALSELEKERISIATAVEESMAMILRLQNEKSLIETESRQYRRLADEKLLYDQQVIESLQWLVKRYDSDRAVLEDQLRLCQQELRLFMKCDEIDQFMEVEDSFSSSAAEFEDALDDSLFSLLDLDSPQELLVLHLSTNESLLERLLVHALLKHHEVCLRVSSSGLVDIRNSDACVHSTRRRLK